MIVTDLYVVGIVIHEPKTDAPLIVDRDGVLPLSIPGQGMQPVAARDFEIIRPCSQIQVFESARRPFGKVCREAFVLPVVYNSWVRRSVNVLITNHNVSRHVTDVNGGQRRAAVSQQPRPANSGDS